MMMLLSKSSINSLIVQWRLTHNIVYHEKRCSTLHWLTPSLNQRLLYEFGCIARWRIFSNLQLLWIVFNKLLLINECNSNFCIPAYVSIENLHAHWLICYDIDIWNNWTNSTHMRCSLDRWNCSSHYIEYFSDFLSTHFYLYSSFFANYLIVILYVFCITVESHSIFDLYRVNRLQLYVIKWIWVDWKFIVTPYLLQIKYFNHKIKLGIRETIFDSSFFFILKISHIAIPFEDTLIELDISH